MSNKHYDHSCNREYLKAEPISLHNDATTASAFPSMTTEEGKAFLDLSPDASLLIDAQGCILLVNEQAAILFGYEQDELVGQSLEILLPERFHNAHVAHRHTYMEAPRRRAMGVGLDLVGRRKDGSEFPVDISLRPVLVEQHPHVLAAIRDVTTQRLMERERTQQAERLALQRALINLSHDAILTCDPINRILSWNRGAEELYGWTEKEALGRITHTLLRTRFPGSRAAITALLECDGGWEGVLVHTCRDGSVVRVESRQVLMRNEQGEPEAILEINRDITRRWQLEQAQTAKHAETLAQRVFLQELLDAFPGSVAVVYGQDARLVLANRAAAHIWGAAWSPEQPMSAFLAEQDIRILDGQGQTMPLESWATIRALRKKETVLQHQETIRQPSGTSLPILVNAVPLRSSHWLSMKNAESSTGKESALDGETLALVLHQDVRALKEAEYFKDEFIGIASHELRQPLAVLRATVGTLILQTERGHGTPFAPWQKELLGDLDQATDRLVMLTEDLLEVSRLQAGQLILQCAPTNLVSLIRRVVEHFQKTTTRHQLTLHTPEETLEATVDPQRIEQILANLLTNAIKYSPQGGPVSVTLETLTATREAKIQVKDQGIGIPLHQQPRIFGRFMRADNAQAADIRGTGLGLYLCHALAEQHLGRLWFESEEGKGTTFFFTLPLIG